MNVETVAIDSLTPDPRNARRHPKRNLDAIKASLTRFGQRKPLVLSADGIVVAGNGTLAAAKALGWTEITVARSDLSGTEAAAYTVADNRAGELAAWDEAGLAERLEEIRNADIDLAAVGYTGNEMADLMAAVADEVLARRENAAYDPADSDDPMGDNDGDDMEPDQKSARPPVPPPDRPAPPPMYPLAIVLDRPAWNRWQALKETREIKSDRDMLLSLIGADE